ncbi:MAG TPA: BatD family protein [Paludibacter sp.]|nr:BatD family protein [Paludibacter sp.]
MKSRILLTIVLLLSMWTVRADEPVRFTASAPTAVLLDRPFQLVYSVNASGKDLRMPDIVNFDILAGPFESHSQSMQTINGKSSSSVSVSYTYTLQAQKTGTFTIPSASITVGGQKYTSSGVSIKVLPADAPQPKSKGGQSASSDNLFIRTSVSKSRVYEQEAIVVTYKLYTLVDVVQCANKKMPDFNGFMKQELEQVQNKQFSYENYNGRNYGTVVLYQVLLYPQHSGTIKIDKAVFDAVVRVQNRATVRSIFDDFFDSYTNVSKTIVAPETKISVNMLPGNKPASFSGLVGHFSMNSNISTEQVKANDAVTIKVNIAGVGNMKLIKNPDIKFPDGFEVYDPKVNNNFKTSASGTAGTKTIEYLFIPRHPGNYEIPAAEFSYFDTQDGKYKMLSTPTYKLQVLKGEGGENVAVSTNYVDKEDVKQLGKDIRYIQVSNIKPEKEEIPVFGTTQFWLMFLVPLLVSLVLFAMFRKQAKDNANLELVKNKKANKVARKRLKLAQKLLGEGNKEKFYEEVLKAVWNYLGDKLSIPVSSLTKERVETELAARNVDLELIAKFQEILNTCEFARYAPNSGQQEMGNLYSDTVDAISRLEELIRKL